MTDSFFNFRHAPFERDIPADRLYLTPAFEELMSRLEYATRNRKFCVVTGDVGIGKSTAIRRFVGSLDPNKYRPVYIADSALTPRVFYWEVLTQLTDDEKPSFYRSEGKRKMMDHISHMSDTANTTLVIIIDEAHLLSRAMLEETRFLLNHRMDSQNPLSLIIVGQSELRTKLSCEIYEPITQRIDFRFKFAPFDCAQTAEYIHAHLAYAGAGAEIFSQSAVSAVFAYSSGIARKINKACSMALLCAAQRSARVIDGGIVEFAIDQELSW
ncbi:hypothetical protein FACS18949_05450 [Clostridia bacterium]|nr:hypothetical protein FACS18949_05450 [Clostridia bacterium]